MPFSLWTHQSSQEHCAHEMVASSTVCLGGWYSALRGPFLWVACCGDPAHSRMLRPSLQHHIIDCNTASVEYPLAESRTYEGVICLSSPRKEAIL